MPTFLTALIPDKNLSYGILGGVITVLLIALVHRYLGLDLAQMVATAVSTPATPVTSQMVMLSMATSIGTLIAHAVDVKAKLCAPSAPVPPAPPAQ